MTTITPKAHNEGKEGPAIGANGTDESRGLRVLTGVLLILTPIAFNALFTLLSMTFEYPDILREPTGYVLRHFDAGGSSLVATWYGFMLTAVLLVPLAVLVHKALTREDTPYMAVATTFGVIAGVVQFLGLVRWPFLAPYLAHTYLDPASSAATRESVAVVFQAFNQYAGVAVGEHLGYLFTGLWTVLVALAMFGSALPFRRWLALLGMVAAAGLLVGTLESAGFEPAADIVVVGYILWSIWLALFGIFLLLPRSIRHCVFRVYPAGKATTRIEAWRAARPRGWVSYLRGPTLPLAPIHQRPSRGVLGSLPRHVTT